MQKPSQTTVDMNVLAFRDRSASVGQDASVNGATPVDTDAFADELMTSISADGGMSADDLGSMRFELKTALDQALEHPSESGPPRHSEWVVAVEALQQIGAVSADETNELIRRLDAAMQPLQQDNVQRALEFGRRCREDGEQSALQWLRNQTAA